MVKKKVLSLLLALIILVVGVVCIIAYKQRTQVDTKELNKKLSEASDLITAKLHITNVTEYKDQGIKILNRSDFTIVYDATVWAGIDVKKVKIDSDEKEKTINISIPKATIQDAKVNPKSIKVLSTKFSLFNINQKEDLAKALTIAERDVKKEAAKTGVLELADKQSATIIKGLLSSAVPSDYKIITKIK